MYSLPQEIEVWYIIPAIRKELAKLLTKKYNLTFEKVGEILGVSKAAISQYLNRKRASLIRFPAKIKKEIENSAEKISEENNLALKEIIRILNLMKKTKCSCSVCKKYNKGILKQCQMKPVLGEQFLRKMRIKLCPRCKSKNIELFAGGINGTYKCTKCGFIGNMFPEIEIKKRRK